MPIFKIPVDIFVDAEDEAYAIETAFEMMLLAKEVEYRPESFFHAYTINNFAVVETSDLEHSMKQWERLQ